MRKSTLERFYVDFSVSELDDDERDALLAGITKVVPSSQLIQGSPALKASAAALITKGATYNASRDKASGSRKQANADAAVATTDRNALDAELLAFVGLVQANAKTSADITSAGLDERPPPAPRPPFAPPDSLDTTFPKKEKGWFKVKPHGIKVRCVWVVQMSHDATNPTTWEQVNGDGNSRRIAGTSGSSVWVRYAMLRGGQLSAWSVPVLVTIP